MVEVVVLLQGLMKDKKVLIKDKHLHNVMCILLIGLEVNFDTGRGNKCYIIELLEG